MEFKDGWLARQAEIAREEIAGWSETKRKVILREPDEITHRAVQ